MLRAAGLVASLFAASALAESQTPAGDDPIDDRVLCDVTKEAALCDMWLEVGWSCDTRWLEKCPSFSTPPHWPDHDGIVLLGDGCPDQCGRDSHDPDLRVSGSGVNPDPAPAPEGCYKGDPGRVEGVGAPVYDLKAPAYAGPGASDSVWLGGFQCDNGYGDGSQPGDRWNKQFNQEYAPFSHTRDGRPVYRGVEDSTIFLHFDHACGVACATGLGGQHPPRWILSQRGDLSHYLHQIDSRNFNIGDAANGGCENDLSFLHPKLAGEQPCHQADQSHDDEQCTSFHPAENTTDCYAPGGEPATCNPGWIAVKRNPEIGWNDYRHPAWDHGRYDCFPACEGAGPQEGQPGYKYPMLPPTGTHMHDHQWCGNEPKGGYQRPREAAEISLSNFSPNAVFEDLGALVGDAVEDAAEELEQKILGEVKTMIQDALAGEQERRIRGRRV